MAQNDSPRSVLLGVLAIVIAAAVVAFAGIPARMAVVEKAQSDVSQRLESMDKKIDVLLGRQ